MSNLNSYMLECSMYPQIHICIDPGYKTGYALLSHQVDHSISLWESGVINSEKSKNQSCQARCRYIHDKLNSILDRIPTRAKAIAWIEEPPQTIHGNMKIVKAKAVGVMKTMAVTYTASNCIHNHLKVYSVNHINPNNWQLSKKKRKGTEVKEFYKKFALEFLSRIGGEERNKISEHEADAISIGQWAIENLSSGKIERRSLSHV